MSGDKEKKEYSALLLHLENPSGRIEINEEVPVQDIVFKHIRCHFASAQDPKAYHVLYLKLPFLSQSHLNSNLPNLGIPLVNSTDGHDSHYEPNIRISMNKKLPKKFNYSIIDRNGDIIPANVIECIEIWCEYNKGKI